MSFVGTDEHTITGPQEANFSYFKFEPAIHSHEKPYEILINLPSAVNDPSGYQRSNQKFEDYRCTVKDVRGTEKNYNLDVNGVCWRHWDGPETWRGVDGEGVRKLGHDGIASTYLRQVETFIKDQLEAQGDSIHLVKVFDYRLRLSMENNEFIKRTLDLSDGLDPMIPVTHPHVDQSFEGAIKRVHHHMGQEAASLLMRRFRIINVWKPLKPIKAWPLAVCDTRTVDMKDLIRSDLVRRKMIGETFYATYNPSHEWCYLSEQQPDEVTMLKIYDSKEKSKARFCLHSSFQNPEVEVKSRRESFEVRAMVFDKIVEDGSHPQKQN